MKLFEIQDVRPGLWLTEKWSTSVPRTYADKVTRLAANVIPSRTISNSSWNNKVTNYPIFNEDILIYMYCA